MNCLRSLRRASRKELRVCICTPKKVWSDTDYEYLRYRRKLNNHAYRDRAADVEQSGGDRRTFNGVARDDCGRIIRADRDDSARATEDGLPYRETECEITEEP